MDGADGTDGADRVDRANKVNGANRANKDGTDVEKSKNPRDLGLKDPQVEKQRVARQVATWLSFFSFVLFFVYFSFLLNQKSATLSDHPLFYPCLL